MMHSLAMLGNYFYVTLSNKNRLGTINIASSFQVHHILPVKLLNSEFNEKLNDILRNEIPEDKTKKLALQSYNNRITLYSGADRAAMIL